MFNDYQNKMYINININIIYVVVSSEDAFPYPMVREITPQPRKDSPNHSHQ